MGRYIGKSIVEFKKGVKGLEDDLEGGAAPRHEGGVVPDQQLRAPQRVAVTAPKFEDAAPAPTTTSVTSAPPKV
jgi:sec-independent protein translocase protein TatA